MYTHDFHNNSRNIVFMKRNKWIHKIDEDYLLLVIDAQLGLFKYKVNLTPTVNRVYKVRSNDI